MDQKKVIIAIALSVILFIVIQFFMGPDTPEQPQAPLPPDVQQSQTEAAQKTLPKTQVIETETGAADQISQPSPLETEALEKAIDAPVAREARNVVVKTNLFQVVLSENGAVIERLALKNYNQTGDKNSLMEELVSPEKNPNGTILTSVWASSDTNLRPIYETTAPELVLAENEKQSVSFSYTSPTGVVTTKTYTFEPNSYIISLAVQVYNGSQNTLSDRLTVALEEDFTTRGQSYVFEGPVVKMGTQQLRIKTKKIKDKDRYTGKIDWIADSSRYFLASVMPINGEEYDLRLNYTPEKMLTSTLVYPEKTIQPNQTITISSDLYFGPKSIPILKEVGRELHKVVNFGMFDILAKPCLSLMRFIYDFIPNYGAAIILMTILIKILLWPLGSKSYKSMAEMRKIQPLLTEMREKYKNDKQKLNQEMMNLYKAYKINPLGGCLPMILQIPVFFALYRMLYEAIELRHAPFFGWIQDLAAPDRLFSFPVTIPYMEPPYGIPVLTILMGASMFLQQKMTPVMGDASQQKVMMLMPIIFTVIFINFSAGLVLYWLVNNIISIGQQYYIQKKYS